MAKIGKMQFLFSVQNYVYPVPVLNEGSFEIHLPIGQVSLGVHTPQNNQFSSVKRIEFIHLVVTHCQNFQ